MRHIGIRLGASRPRLRSFTTLAPPPPPSPVVNGPRKYNATAVGSLSPATGKQKVVSSVLSADALVPYIPTFFITLSDLKPIPGYSIEHIKTYFMTTNAIQLIKLGEAAEHQFIRLHGNDGQFDMRASYKTNHLYAHRRPDPIVAEFFVTKLARAGKPLTLADLMDRADPEILKKMPFSEPPGALTFFSQMQHKMNFRANPQDWGASLIAVHKDPPMLTASTSPTPIALNEVLRVCSDEKMSLDKLNLFLDGEVKEEVKQFFGDTLAFIRAHGKLLAFANNEVASQSLVNRLQRAEMSDEEKLKVWMKDPHRYKAKIRLLERRIALRDDPNNAMLDRANLVDTVAKYVPPGGHISLPKLLGILPNEVRKFLPSNTMKFFQQAHQVFQLFELSIANNWHVCHAATPLPPGHLKTEFSEQDLLELVVKKLSTLNPQKAGGLMTHLPGGARAVIRQNYTNLTYFLAKFPKNFSLTQPNPKLDIKDPSTVVTMIAPPPLRQR